MKQKILVIDDDEFNCNLIKDLFFSQGCEVACSPNSLEAVKLAETMLPDLILLDVKLPMTGVEVLDKIKFINDSAPIIVLTDHEEVKSAVRTAQLGASDYLSKPIDRGELLAVVRRALEGRALRREVNVLREKLCAGGVLAEQMGPSEQARQVIEQVRIVAPSDYTVLIVGETGTGKEIVAKAIFHLSERRKKPFIAIDCGAIPEALLESEFFGHERGAFSGADRKKKGQFQLAEGGTVLLDEIGNLPMHLQAKLLRVLESKHVHPVGSEKPSPMDVRFLAATNFDLHDRVTKGLFRADLYFRLAQYTISLKSLRERIDDIPYLAQRFADEASIELRKPVQKISAEAIETLQQYKWPGNVRELKNVIRQAVLHTKKLEIDSGALRGLIKKEMAIQSHKICRDAGATLKQVACEAAQDAERALICESLRINKGNKSQVARQLSTDFKTLHLKMKSFGIRAADFVP